VLGARRVQLLTRPFRFPTLLPSPGFFYAVQMLLRLLLIVLRLPLFTGFPEDYAQPDQPSRHGEKSQRAQA